MLITANERERKILNLAFSQHQIEVIEAEPDRASYIKALQYVPDIVLMEFPQTYSEQLHFARNVSSALLKKKKLLLIGYGRKMISSEMRALTESGVKHHLGRPLKFSLIMDFLEKHFEVFAPDKLVWKNKKNNSSTDEDYVEQMFNIDILPTQKLEILRDRIESLMAFPFTVMQVLQLTESEQSGAGDLAKVINADPVISANILKLANTVFFASRNRKITTIKDSIIRIGFTETKHLVMAMSVMESMGDDTDNLGFDRTEFWYHSISVAVIAEHISKELPMVNSSEMFLAGLLHSFGTILLDEFFADLFKELLLKTTDRGGTFLSTQKDLMIVTDVDLTCGLFESWKIPSSITDAVKNSNQIDQVLSKEPGNVTGEEKSGVVIYVADLLAKSLSLGQECDQVVTHIDGDLLALLGKKTGVLPGFLETVQHEIRIFKKFFNLKNTEVEVSDDSPELLLVAPPLPFFTPAEYFVKSEGYNVTRYVDSADQEQYRERFSAAVFWFNENCDQEVVSVVQKLRDANGESLIALVFSSDTNNENSDTVQYFPNIVDLRLLKIALADISSVIDIDNA